MTKTTTEGAQSKKKGRRKHPHQKLTHRTERVTGKEGDRDRWKKKRGQRTRQKTEELPQTNLSCIEGVELDKS